VTTKIGTFILQGITRQQTNCLERPYVSLISFSYPVIIIIRLVTYLLKILLFRKGS